MGAAVGTEGEVAAATVVVARSAAGHVLHEELGDDENDPLGKQVSDILAGRLVESDRFLVFERPDINKLKAESALSGQALDIVGVDTMIFGSLTEFGHSTTGKKGFMSSTKKQTAEASVELRLVDVKTGHVFFTAKGTGTATV